jgi:thiosulfate reductase cytochrome b subunit
MSIEGRLSERKRSVIWALIVVAGLWAVSAARAAEVSNKIANEDCIGCHNADILELNQEELEELVAPSKGPAPSREKPPYVFGELNQAINVTQYQVSVHGELMCIECHKDVELVDVEGVEQATHARYLEKAGCNGDCHKTEQHEIEQVHMSAHGRPAGAEAVPCIGCHNPHYDRGPQAYQEFFEKQGCIDCHRAYGIDNLAAHRGLYEPNLHMNHQCMVCHQDKEEAVHTIPSVNAYVAECMSCHDEGSILAKAEPAKVSFLYPGFLNKGVLKCFGYVVGANRVPALDALLVLLVLAPFGLPVVHGGLRFLTRRGHTVKPTGEEVLLHPLIERIWHWGQAICILVLIVTGVMIHWPGAFPGLFPAAVAVHNAFGALTVLFFVLWLVYNLASGRIQHYIPRKEEIPMGIIKQARFYLYGIFKHEPHPYVPTEENKFNPLQRVAYFQFQALLLPILLLSGILYLYPNTFRGVIDAIGGMAVLGLVHLVLGALFASFLVAHLYLATTGETVGENLKAITFGYGSHFEHETHPEKTEHEEEGPPADSAEPPKASDEAEEKKGDSGREDAEKSE